MQGTTPPSQFFEPFGDWAASFLQLHAIVK